MNPQWVTTDEIPPEAVAKEREIRLEQAAQSGKPENVREKIVEGQLKKWRSEVCLMEQAFVKDDKKSINMLLGELVAQIGENCKVRRFVRWEVGEGIEVVKKDLAEEIAELQK